MENEKVISRLKQLLVTKRNVGDLLDVEAISCALNVFEEWDYNNKISALEQQRWIPISERLPEEETDVLVCNINGDIEISSGSYSTEINEFIWYTSGWRFGDVIAWMPLPQPYKAESEEAG